MKQAYFPLDEGLLRQAAALLPRRFEENQTILPWRQTRTPYGTWVSEIMLQQTRTAAVIPYFERFMTELPSLQALAAADEDKLLKLWEGLGYYSRVRNLGRAARATVERFGGELPRTARELCTLPGIGEYTAGAIASICFGKPEPAVDGNVLRVMMRLCGCDMDVALPETKKRLTEALRAVYPSGERAGQLTEGIMELGEQVCLPNGTPKCLHCPLAEICVGLREGTHLTLPKKSPKKQRKIQPRTVLVLRFGNTYALQKRPEKGLLAGLWELPTVDGQLAEQAALTLAESLGVQPHGITPLGETTHVFTHVEWHMTGYLVDCERAPDTLTWATASQIQGHYALPTALKFYTEQIIALATESYEGLRP